MRLFAVAVLVFALGAGAAGCKTIYEPILVDGRVVAGVVVPPEPGPTDANRRPIAVPGEPGKFYVMRARTVVDWEGIGNGAGHFFEALGKGALVVGYFSLQVLAHLPACLCR